MELVLVAVGGLLFGVAAGWWLRPATVWCPSCGWRLRCGHCGHRPGIFRNKAGTRTCGAAAKGARRD